MVAVYPTYNTVPPPGLEGMSFWNKIFLATRIPGVPGPPTNYEVRINKEKRTI